MSSRIFALCALAFWGLHAFGASAETTAAVGKTLRFVPHAELKIVDPTFTTAYVTRNMGHLVYDTLFAQDRQGKPHPQMVQTYTVSPDGLAWRFTLRPGLKFSDGAPVTSRDVLASIQRWARHDSAGALMVQAGAKWKRVDDRTFTLTLREPFGLVLEALSRPSSYPVFIYPRRLAEQPAGTPIKEVLGSGPFMLQRHEGASDKKTVFVRNPHYVARTETPDGLAGSKAPKFDRIEWLYMPDTQTSIAALKRGDVDYIEQVVPDYIALLKADADVKIVQGGAYQGFLMFNHLHPPFDKAKVRQAVQMALDQEKMLVAMGFPAAMRMPHCTSYFVCGSPNATTAGAAEFRQTNEMRARQLLAEGGYQGEKVVLLVPTDVVYLAQASLMAAQTLRSIGMNVDIQQSNWAALTMRRTKRDRPSAGGWSMYFTVGGEFDANSPVTSMLGSPCGSNEPGWVCDQQLDQLRGQWVKAANPNARKLALDAFHTRAYQVMPYAIAGQYATAAAASRSLQGLEQMWAGIPNLWVLDK